MVIKNAIPKFIALLIVCAAASFFAIDADNRILSKADSMSSADFIAYARGLFQHSFIHHYILLFLTCGLFLACVEFLAYVIGLLFRKGRHPNSAGI